MLPCGYATVCYKLFYFFWGFLWFPVLALYLLLLTRAFPILHSFTPYIYGLLSPHWNAFPCALCHVQDSDFQSLGPAIYEELSLTLPAYIFALSSLPHLFDTWPFYSALLTNLVMFPTCSFIFWLECNLSFVVRKLVTREGFNICKSARHKKNFNIAKTEHIAHKIKRNVQSQHLRYLRDLRCNISSIRLVKIKNHNMELWGCREISSLLVGIAVDCYHLLEDQVGKSVRNCLYF